jgi:hypothetical protein
MEEGKRQREELQEYLVEPSTPSRQREIMDMSLEDMGKELATSGWKPKPNDGLPVLGEVLLSGVEETACVFMQI